MHRIFGDALFPAVSILKRVRRLPGFALLQGGFEVGQQFRAYFLEKFGSVLSAPLFNVLFGFFICNKLPLLPLYRCICILLM